MREGTCDRCGKTKQQYGAKRHSAHKKGYTSRWQRYRLSFLKRNPLCVKCLEFGHTTQATDVDHIEPITGPKDPMFWKRENHQALCSSCHGRKTRQDQIDGKAKSLV